MDEKNIVYTVVSDTAGHLTKTETLPKASEDIFKLVKTRSMQCAVEGEFIQFDSLDELQSILEGAVKTGFNINIYDENLGG